MQYNQASSSGGPALFPPGLRYAIDPTLGRPVFKQEIHVPMRKRIAIIGARGIGKSAMLHRAMSDTFTKAYHPTIEDSYVWRTKVDGVEYEITLVDTKGVDEHSGHLGIQYSIDCDGYVLAFSLQDEHSLSSLRFVHSKLLRTLCATFRYGTTEIPRVLVGTQRDPQGDRPIDEHISKAATAFARRNGLPYMEVSSSHSAHSEITNVFHSVIKIIHHNLKASYTATAGNAGQRASNMLVTNARLQNPKLFQQQAHNAQRRRIKNSTAS